jgi:hypothetical protein
MLYALCSMLFALCSLRYALCRVSVYTISMDHDEIDEALGISRCARCGHRLDGEIECPFCSLFPTAAPKESPPKWIFVTACFLASPLSLPAITRTDRLTLLGKVLTFSGCLFWLCVYRLFF